MTQLLASTMTRARKHHRCSACYGDILAGQQYERQSCVEDGEAYTFKMCARCLAYIESYDKAVAENNALGKYRQRTFYQEYEDGLPGGTMLDCDGYKEFCATFSKEPPHA